MLIGLLRGKVERYLTRPAREIEDLLTATVLGSCRYLDPHEALLPFLGEAVDVEERRLLTQLSDIVEVDIDEDAFWPRWSRSADPSSPDDATNAGWNEPEVVVRLKRADGTRAWVLVEAKLLSGKSSIAQDGGAVHDQLGKYWVHLEEQAGAMGATPLAIVYLTTGTRRTDDEFAATQSELRDKGHSLAPLYWLSWRTFVAVAGKSSNPLVRDVCRLLREEWQLAPIEPLRPWPRRPTAQSRSRWRVGVGLRWPRAQVKAQFSWRFM